MLLRVDLQCGLDGSEWETPEQLEPGEGETAFLERVNDVFLGTDLEPWSASGNTTRSWSAGW